jgi:hypothetical protein
MTLQTRLEDPRAACHAVKAVAGDGLSMIPFNRFKPEDTLWWLSPSAEIPAYRHGKFIFCWDTEEAEGKELAVGYYVEKGLSGKAASVFGTDRDKIFLMNSDWAWHAFLGGIRSGEVRKALRRVTDDIGEPLDLWVFGGVFHNPRDAESAKGRNQWKGVIRHELSPGSDLLALKQFTPGDGALKGIEKATHLADFGAALGKASMDDWTWIDVRISMRMSVIPSGSPPASCPPAGEIWNRLLRPFGKWVV